MPRKWISQALEVAGIGLLAYAVARLSVTAAIALVGLYAVVASVAIDRGGK